MKRCAACPRGFNVEEAERAVQDDDGRVYHWRCYPADSVPSTELNADSYREIAEERRARAAESASTYWPGTLVRR